MRRPGGKTDIQIKSDLGAVTYMLSSRFSGSRGEKAAMEYLSNRDFSLEPLSTEAASELIKERGHVIRSTSIDDFYVEVDLSGQVKPLTFTISQFQDWGYSVDEVTKPTYNTDALNHPIYRLVFKKSPSVKAQLFSLAKADLDPEVFLDTFATVFHNIHAEPENEIGIGEWATSRGVSPKVVKDNQKKAHEKYKRLNGIPGTQWECFETDRSTQGRNSGNV